MNSITYMKGCEAVTLSTFYLTYFHQIIVKLLTSGNFNPTPNLMILSTHPSLLYVDCDPMDFIACIVNG